MRQVFPLLLGALAALSGGPTEAAPRVVVRGRTSLSLRSIAVHARGATFVARLEDASLRRGIPGARLRIRLDRPNGRPLTATARTDRRGDAHFHLPTRRGRYTLSSRYGGDTYYSASQLKARQVDLSKATVTIKARFKRPLDASRAKQEIEVALFAADEPIAGTLLVYARKKAIARIAVPEGPLVVGLGTQDLGHPGPLRLRLHFPATPRLNSADEELRSILVTPVKLSLEADHEQLPHDGALSLRGTLHDSIGPVPRATISLHAMGQHVLSAVTDSKGFYALNLAARDFPPGPLDLRATFSPAVPWRKSAKSRALQIQILPPRPLSVRAYALSTLGTLLILLLLWGWRRRDLFLPSRKKEAEEVAPAHDGPPAAPAEGGLVRARSRHILRQEHGISGTIWDPVDQRPLAGAQVVIPLQEATRQARSDEEGRFAMHQLPAGRHQVEVSCDGYLPERFAIELPHRGPLHGMRVDLIAVRVRLLEVYRAVAHPRLPRSALWGRWTPRELLTHLQEPSRSAFAELSRLLERSYWSGDPPTEEILRRAEELWSRIDTDGAAL